MPGDDYDDDIMDSEDLQDAEWEQETGGATYADPTVIYVARVLSSTGSTAARTTYLCETVNIINDEIEGAVLATEDIGAQLLATNITTARPPTDGTAIVPVFKINDRFVMVYYG
jgi:hypothetical protein